VNRQAFTLIELMVVVAIIAFLSSIAIPRYFRYYAKAKQVEVAIILASLHTAQQMYWAEHGTYSTNLNGVNGVGWKPEGYNGGGKRATFYYTYGFYFPGAQEGVHYFTGKLEAPTEALGECYADKEKFLARAAGDITCKNKLDIWSIEETRTIKHDRDGAS